MRCRTAQQLISLYIAPQKSWLTPEDRQALEAHLAVCEPCRRDCRESREAVGMVQQCWQISADTRALLGKQRHGSSHRAIRLHPTSRRVAVWIGAAACLVVGLLAWRAIVEQQARMTRPAGPVASSGEGTTLLIGWAGDGGRIAPGTVVLTSAMQIRTLVINDKHQLTLDAGTELSIEPLAEAGAAGCLVRLAWGRICAQVDHDGHPFAVQTPHGRAVITGTTFDVKTTPAGTTLVVVEGSVRFESEAGAVQVAAGHYSRITAPSSPPSAPALSDAAALIAWAGLGQRTAQVAGILPSDDLLLADLPATPSSREETRIDLDRIDYARWIEQKRGWFQQQFPWVFELQEVLATNSRPLTTDVEYPELLIQTGDIWQIAYPHRPYRQIPVILQDSLSRIADRYELDSTWFDRIASQTRSTDVPTAEMFFGKDALNQWLTLTGELEDACANTDRLNELCEYSMVIGEYLENTRTLAWLCLRKGSLKVQLEQKEAFLSLLEQQITSAHQAGQAAWCLSQTENCSAAGEIRRLITLIETIRENETQLSDCRPRPTGNES